jgi:hypothetical protein
VVGRDEQRRRVGERLVGEQHPWIDVPVRRDDRRGPQPVVQRAGERPDGPVGRQQPIRVRREAGWLGHVADRGTVDS